MSENVCECGCGTSLRKDNRSGYAKGHKPCPVCGTLVSKNNTECCSKVCSAKLHWQRHPEMKDNRAWNEDRTAVRSHNPNWKDNASKARKKFFLNGGKNWNDGLTKETDVRLKTQGETFSQHIKDGYITPSFLGRKHKAGWYDKVKETNLKLYGVENCFWMATHANTSKLEKSCIELLLQYGFIHNKFLGRHQIDFVNYGTKQIVEIFGDYWHCNPDKYTSDYYHSQIKKSAKEIWDKDFMRLEKFKSYGYQPYVIWEQDIKKYGIGFCFNKEISTNENLV